MTTLTELLEQDKTYDWGQNKAALTEVAKTITKDHGDKGGYFIARSVTTMTLCGPRRCSSIIFGVFNSHWVIWKLTQSRSLIREGINQK